MPKIPSSSMTYAIDSVAFECNLTSLTRGNTREAITAESLCPAETPIRFPGRVDWNTSGNGDNDFDAGSIDDTLFGLFADDAGVATILDPTGAGTAAANAPQYTGSEVIEMYDIQFNVGQMVKHSFRLAGAGTQTRDVGA